MNIFNVKLSIVRHVDIRNLQFTTTQSVNLQADVHVNMLTVLNTKCQMCQQKLVSKKYITTVSWAYPFLSSTDCINHKMKIKTSIK